MVKLLIGGNLLEGNASDGWTALVGRVQTLQESQHGPFAALFIAGSLFASAEQYQFALSSEAPQLCIPTHLTNLPSFAAAHQLPPNVIFSGTGLATVATLTVTYLPSSTGADDVASLRDRVSNPAYRGCDLLLSEDWPKEMHHFVDESEYQAIQACLGPGTMGLGSAVVADVATIVRPRYHFSAARNVFFQRSPYRNADLALSGASSSYGPPPSTAPCTRFISLAGVSQSKDKDKKWLHALSLDPIVYMSAADVAVEPPGTTDSPYVQVGSLSKAARPVSQSLQDRVASGEPDPKRWRGTGSGAIFFGHQGVPRNDSVGALAAAPPPPPVNLIPPSISATTLFIGGTPRGMRVDAELKAMLEGCVSVRSQEGKGFVFADFDSHDAALRMVEGAARVPFVFQGRALSIGWASSQTRPPRDPPVAAAGGAAGAARAAPMSVSAYGPMGTNFVPPPPPPAPPSRDAKVLFIGGLSFATGVAANCGPPLVSILVLAPLMPGLASVRLVPNKAFAFAEFGSHEEALAVVEGARAAPLVMQGPAREDGTTGYELTIGWAKTSPASLLSAQEQLWQGQGSGVLLNPPSASSSTLFLSGLPESADGAVVNDEAVLGLFAGLPQGPGGSIISSASLRRPEGKNFAFVQFASHSDAVLAMSLRTALPSGGAGLLLHGAPILLGWAKGRSMEGRTNVNRHSDHEADCWFCLASPQLKTHLIMSVAGAVYLALPRGAMHPMHCIICPIECVPNRIHLPPAALREMTLYETAVEAMLAAKGMGLLRFERCIRTDGKDHMQQHLVPVPPERVAGALVVFLQQVAACGLKFREIPDGKNIDETVVSMEGGPYQEYFFVSVPVGSDGITSAGPRIHKRFLFVLEEEPLRGTTDGSSKHRFPMQFGNEVAALVLGQPERANWKKCVVSQEEEERLAVEFRETFAAHDFAAAMEE